MSAKLIIYVSGKPSLHGHKQREFQWNPAHGCYIYEGVEFDAAEFNPKYLQAIRTNADLNPKVRVVGVDGDSVVAPIAAVTVAHEITVDEAVAVLTREAPERLKKRTGPKPAMHGATVEV